MPTDVNYIMCGSGWARSQLGITGGKQRVHWAKMKLQSGDDIVVFKPPASARSSSVSKKHLKHIRKGTDDFIQLIVKLENMMVSK